MIKVNQSVLFEVGEKVMQAGYYICVPCGNKRFFEKDQKFPSCLSCLSEDKITSTKNPGLWEKVLEKATIKN